MKKKYKVIRSFSSTEIGSLSEGDVVELSDEQARGVAVFLQPMERDEAPIETADLPTEKVEKAVIKRKKKASE